MTDLLLFGIVWFLWNITIELRDISKTLKKGINNDERRNNSVT